MHAATLVTGWLLSTALAQPAPPPPIVSGSETSAHPAVGAFVADDGLRAASFCSGSLASPTRVVTAAHCVEAMVEYDEQGYAILFMTGEDVSTSSGTDSSTRVTAAVIHPEYTLQPFLMADLAVAILEEELSGVEPIPLSTTGPSDLSSDELTHVGYGADADDGSGGGVKREATLAVTDYDGHFLYSEDTSGSNVCMGDSGGASLSRTSRGDLELVGVIAFTYDPDGGAPQCSGGAAGSTRIDRNLDFINAVLDDEDVDEDGVWGATTGDVSSGGGTLMTDSKAGCSVSAGGRAGGLGLAVLGLVVARRRR